MHRMQKNVYTYIQQPETMLGGLPYFCRSEKKEGTAERKEKFVS
jgi:hypothetical protein